MIDILIPSYHRPDNLKTVNFFLSINWNPQKIHVVIDDEADDVEDYKKVASAKGFNLHIFNMEEARKRYDYVHRPSMSRRSAGQARNMFQDYANKIGLDFYVVQDDDTTYYQLRRFGRDIGKSTERMIKETFDEIEAFMRKHHIGMFGLSQSGDFYGTVDCGIMRRKVMNTTFYLLPYVYRGERGVQDDDTSLFCGVHNEGLFTGSVRDGVVLNQTLSATSRGGLTDLYNECKLLNKALVCPIQFPSAIHAEKQQKNGNRVHHRINYRYLSPCVIRGEVNNIPWDTYEEDFPFTNEPKRLDNVINATNSTNGY